MKYVVVIVNYCTADLVCDCLRSLHAEVLSGGAQVVVVDNHSPDDSVHQISFFLEENAWSHWVQLLPQQHNLGFAAGNNAAIRWLLSQGMMPDFLMLLNPDTLVHPGSLSRLVCFLDEHPETGIVGAQLLDQNQVLQSSARRFPSALSELDEGARLGLLSGVLDRWRVSLPLAERAHQCDWVSGAAMMVRWKVFEEIGLMDEGYFLYFEELDFCLRAKSAGWQIWLEPTARITHLEGKATGIKQVRRRRESYWYDSRRRYFIKHHGVGRLIVADMLWVFGRLTLLFRAYVGLGGDVVNDPKCFIRDLFIGDLLALVRNCATVKVN